MKYSLSTLRRKANEAGYSFQKGYQRYNHDGWGYVRTWDGERIVGYQILDHRTNFLVHKSLSSSLEIVTGIKNITFKSITDYIILVVYLLKCFGVPKGDMRRFVAEFQDNIETLRKQIPTSLFTRIVLTDTRPKLKSLQEYIRK